MIKKKFLFILTLLLSINLFLAGCSSGYTPEESIELEFEETEIFSEDEAKEKAVEYIELSPEEVDFLNVDFIENEINNYYKIHFEHNGEEYEVNIDHKTGEVISEE